MIFTLVSPDIIKYLIPFCQKFPRDDSPCMIALSSRRSLLPKFSHFALRGDLSETNSKSLELKAISRRFPPDAEKRVELRLHLRYSTCPPRLAGIVFF